MPYASNDGVRIHYHVAGDEARPPLVLQHGFSGSLHDLEEAGYVAALSASYRLILIDARGHGASDKPHDPDAYRPATMVADVVAVLDALGIDRAHYLGYSMGGRIGFGLAARAPGRCRSLLLGGASAGETDPATPDPFIPVLRRGPQAFADFWGERISPAWRERIRRNDTEALIACRSVRERHGHAAALPGLAVPTLLYCGDGDPLHDEMRATADGMPRACFTSLPGLDHLGAYLGAAQVVPPILTFLAEVDERGERDHP